MCIFHSRQRHLHVSLFVFFNPSSVPGFPVLAVCLRLISAFVLPRILHRRRKNDPKLRFLECGQVKISIVRGTIKRVIHCYGHGVSVKLQYGNDYDNTKITTDEHNFSSINHHNSFRTLTPLIPLAALRLFCSPSTTQNDNKRQKH